MIYINNALKSTILMLRSSFETEISEEEYYVLVILII